MAPGQPARPSHGRPRRPQARPALAQRRSYPLRCRLLCCPQPGSGTSACGPGQPAPRWRSGRRPPICWPPGCWPVPHRPLARSRWHPRTAAGSHVPAPGPAARPPLAAQGLPTAARRPVPRVTRRSVPLVTRRPVPLVTRRLVPPVTRRPADPPAWLPRGAHAAADPRLGPGPPGPIPAVPLLMDLQVRCLQLTRQLALCSVARSRASGRSLSSGSRAQGASAGRSAPRGSCSLALAGAVLATSAVSASGRIATICPCSALRLPGRSAAAVIPALSGSAAASVPCWSEASGN